MQALTAPAQASASASADKKDSLGSDPLQQQSQRQQSSSRDSGDMGEPGLNQEQCAGGRKILLLAAKWETEVAVCDHTGLDQIYLLAADPMRAPGTRTACIHEGVIVPYSGQVKDWSSERQMRWIVTTLPLATSPKAFQLRRTAGIVLEQQDLRCLNCAKGIYKEIRDNSDYDTWEDATLMRELRRQHQGRGNAEVNDMMCNDQNVKLITLKRPRQEETQQVVNIFTAQQLREVLAKQKRVAPGRLRIFKEIEDEHNIEEGDTIFVHADTKRGGGRAQWTEEAIYLNMPNGDIVPHTLIGGLHRSIGAESQTAAAS